MTDVSTTPGFMETTANLSVARRAAYFAATMTAAAFVVQYAAIPVSEVRTVRAGSAPPLLMTTIFRVGAALRWSRGRKAETLWTTPSVLILNCHV